MKLTIFEKDYLGIKNNSYVIRLFHTLLQKVERDPHRQWTHKLLRNYVNATYELCTFIGKRSSEQLGDSSINICEDDDSDLNIFFTGLYTSDTYHGLKNGLYFVGNPTEGFSVMTRKDIFETASSDVKNALMQINHRDSFENELVGEESLCINAIKPPKIMDPKTANSIIKEHRVKIDKISEILDRIKQKESFDEILKEDVIKDVIKGVLEENNKKIDLCEKSEIIDVLKEFEDTLKGNSWLHILRDGIDNLPTDFVKSFFNKSYEVSNPQAIYENRKKWIEDCIQKSAEDGTVNSFKYYQEIMLETMQLMVDESKIHNLPVMFYKKQRSYNYLLPMYLQNSGKPDFCIVLKHKKKNGKYTGDWEPVTSLDMDEVYCDIRVFGKDAIERVRDWW